MPNKTIYVSDDDLPLFQRAQEIAGGKLSAAITAALRRYVEVEEGRQQGFEEVSTVDQFGLGEIVAVERKKIERHEDGMRDVSLPPH